MGQLPPYQQPKWGMGCSGQSWFPASTSPLSKVSVIPEDHGCDALLAMKITHSASRRSCLYRITLAWPCRGQWDNPLKVGLETLKLHHQPKNGFMAGPIHFSTTSPRQKTNHQTLSGSFIYFFFFWKHFNSYRMFYILQ